MSLPRLHSIKLLSKGLNSQFNIFPAPNGIIGVQQHLKDRLEACLQSFPLKDDEVIQVKLTGDGTIIRRSLHVINIAFTLINDISSVSSYVGNHTLAIIKCSEDYSSLSEALTDLLNEASELQELTVLGKTS